MKIFNLLAAACVLLASAALAMASAESAGMTAEEALSLLVEGNARFVEGGAEHPNQSAERVAEVTAGQHPFAGVVGCSDSRVPPEIIFDQGIGDLFVIRTAGQVMDDATLGSIEYAVEHLHVPLIVVLGHDSCGAVTAAVEGGEAEGHLVSIVEGIAPAVEAAGNESDVLNSAIDANIDMVVENLKSSQPILAQAASEGQVQIMGARYHLDTGMVDFNE
ncbi:MAG: carbonic anhydrase [Methanosarcinales archaeon]|nr:carbonic anhydrase [Methanosarcinales archaeon]